MNDSNNKNFLTIYDIVGFKKRGQIGLIQVSRSTWLKGVANGTFPQPVFLASRTKRWTKKSIDDFITNGGKMPSDAKEGAQ
jgi:predicted DNA-binding transcriptional regulator AlpA